MYGRVLKYICTYLCTIVHRVGLFYSFEFLLTNTLWFSWEKKSTWIVFIGNSRFLYYLCAIQITVTDLMKYSPEIGHLKKTLQSLFYEYEMCYYSFLNFKSLKLLSLILGKTIYVFENPTLWMTTWRVFFQWLTQLTAISK